MLIDTGLLLLGGVMLYFGAEWLVRGAAGLARVLGVAPLLIGLTVISYGTSAPELAVSLIAASKNQTDICLGNVVGSNVANIGLILGTTALIAPPKVDKGIGQREVMFLVVATLATPIVLIGEEINRLEGALFFIGSVVFTWATVRWARKDKEKRLAAEASADDEEDEMPDEVPETTSKPMLALLVLVGLGVLVGGGDVFVRGAIGLAREFGMSERMVGLTVVAFGTSLPELAASLVAALRGHSELAVGNVVGSNIFNLLLILGTTSMIMPIPANLPAMWLDLGVMIALTFVCAFAMRKERQVSRGEGVFFLLSYVGFIVTLVLVR